MVIVDFEKKEYQFEDGIKVKKIIKNLRVNPETVLTIHEDQLVTEDETLSGGRLRIIRIISGG